MFPTERIVDFVIGLVVGALGTVAVFRSSISVLQVQVTALVSSVGEIKNKLEKTETDLNNIVHKLRDEIRETVDEYNRKSGAE